jgi:hypothetical protein
LDGESRKNFLSHLGALQDEFQPRTASERLLVEKFAMAQWRQSRLQTFERNAILREAAKQKTATGITDPSIVDGLAFESLTRSSISEHEMRLDRQVARWYDRLMKLQSTVRTQEDVDKKGSREKENPRRTRRKPGKPPAPPTVNLEMNLLTHSNKRFKLMF